MTLDKIFKRNSKPYCLIYLHEQYGFEYFQLAQFLFDQDHLPHLNEISAFYFIIIYSAWQTASVKYYSSYRQSHSLSAFTSLNNFQKEDSSVKALTFAESSAEIVNLLLSINSGVTQRRHPINQLTN